MAYDSNTLTPLVRIQVILESEMNERIQSSLFAHLDRVIDTLLSSQEFDKLFEDDVITGDLSAEEDHMNTKDLVFNESLDWANVSNPALLFKRDYQFQDNRLTVTLVPDERVMKENFPQLEPQIRRVTKLGMFLGTLVHPIALLLMPKQTKQELQERAQQKAEEIVVRRTANAVAYLTRRYVREHLKAALNPTPEQTEQLAKGLVSEVSELAQKKITVKMG